MELLRVENIYLQEVDIGAAENPIVNFFYLPT